MTVYAADFGPECATSIPGITELDGNGGIVVPRTTAGIAHVVNGFFVCDFTPNQATGVLKWDCDGLIASETVNPVPPTAFQIRAEMDANSTKLANLDATISSRSTYAGADTSGTATLLTRLSSSRAAKLDNIDALISTRLATANYTAPDNAGIAVIKTKTDNLPADPASNTQVNTRLASSEYTAPPSVADIWGHAARTLTAFSFGVTVTTNNDKTGYALTQSFPSNFASLGIDQNGKISGVLLCETTTTVTNAPASVTPQQIWEYASRALTDKSGFGLTAQEVENAVWDATADNHTTAGSAGEMLHNAGNAVDPWALTYEQLQAYDAETAAGLIYKLNVGEPTAPVLVIPAPAVGDQAVVFLDTERLDGVSRAGISVFFKLDAAPAATTRVLEMRPIRGITDGQGRMILTLKRTDFIWPEGHYYLVSSDELGIYNQPLTIESPLIDLNAWVKSLNA